MKQQFLVDDIVVEWRHNKRRKRNVGFNFHPDGRLVLDAPPRTRPAELEGMVREHIRWIRHRLRRAKDNAPEFPPLTIEDGAIVPYLGQTLTVQWRQDRSPSVEVKGRKLHVNSRDPGRIRDLVRSWYRGEGETLFEDLISGWRGLPWLKGRDISWRQRYMKSQWGSCSAKGVISLNTHLVKLPEELVDYVVLHELCHVKHMDHSRRFHNLMYTHMPDWEKRRRGLHRHLSVLLGD